MKLTNLKHLVEQLDIRRDVPIDFLNMRGTTQTRSSPGSVGLAGREGYTTSYTSPYMTREEKMKRAELQRFGNFAYGDPSGKYGIGSPPTNPNVGKDQSADYVRKHSGGTPAEPKMVDNLQSNVSVNRSPSGNFQYKINLPVGQQPNVYQPFAGKEHLFIPRHQQIK